MSHANDLRVGPQWNELTAVFGGRFDPPHLGHTEAVKGLFKNPGVREVVILPSPTPAHKPAVASPEHRLEMARLAFQSGMSTGLPPEIRFDLREFERARTHPGEPTYSFNTLSKMSREFSGLAFVIGTDQLENLPQWHRFPDVLGLCHWIVLERKNSPIGLEILTEWEASGIAQRIADFKWRLKSGSTHLILVPTDAPALSSTEIRESIARTGLAQSGSPGEKTQLCPAVYAYLKNHGLYGSTP